MQTPVTCRSQPAPSGIKTAATSATLALLFAALLGIVGPALDDHGDEFAQAANIEDAIRTEQAQARFERAAQAMCGQNAAWRLTSTPGEVQCLTKHGHKTIVAQVQP